MVTVLGRYAARFIVRVDHARRQHAVGRRQARAAGGGARVRAAPAGADASHGFALSSGSWITGATTGSCAVRRHPLRLVVLLAGAGVLMATLLAAGDQTRFRHGVLAVNVPVMSFGKTPETDPRVLEIRRRLGSARRRADRVRQHRAVARCRRRAAAWRSRSKGSHENAADDPHARTRSVPGFFALAFDRRQRDFTGADRLGQSAS
jgi:hypothetical protein